MPVNTSIKNVSFKRLSVLGVLSISAFVVPNFASAAKLTLSNGDSVTGKIVSLVNDKLVFKSPVLGEISLKFSDVKSLVGDDGQTIKLSDGRQVVGRLAVDDQQLTIDQSQLGKSRSLDRSSLVAINPPQPQVGVKYSGRLNVGGSFTRGNSEEDVLNIDGELVARTAESRYTGTLEVNETKTGGVTTTSNQMLGTKYDAFLTEKDFLFVAAKFEADDQLDLNLRTSLGAGYGRQIYENEVTNLSAEVGLSYTNEDYEIGQDDNFPSLTMAANYDRKLFEGSLVLFNKSNLSVNLEESKDALFKNKLGLRMPVGQHLNLSTQLNVDYDNQPAIGTKKTDTSLIFSVGAGF